MAISYEVSASQRVVALSLTVALGGCAAFGPDTKTIDCAQQPGESIELTVNMTLGGEKGILAVAGADKHDLSVSAPNPLNGYTENMFLMGTEGAPVGVGGTKKEIDAAGPEGMALFGNPRKQGVQPPYYQTVAISKGGQDVLVRLTCDANQTVIGG